MSLIIIIPKLLFKGLQLFFILPLCFFSRTAFTHYWNKYYTMDLEPNIFNLCVQWLLYTGKKLNLSYQRINVLVFCIVWPVLTILSVLLNIILVLFCFSS